MAPLIQYFKVQHYFTLIHPNHCAEYWPTDIWKKRQHTACKYVNRLTPLNREELYKNCTMYYSD